MLSSCSRLPSARVGCGKARSLSCSRGRSRALSAVVKLSAAQHTASLEPVRAHSSKQDFASCMEMLCWQGLPGKLALKTANAEH
jgi:hypothetical protein